MRKWWSGFSREYKLLLLSMLFLGVTSGLYDPTFNNYLSDVFHLSARVRGYLEFPRELPGFLVALVSGLFLFVADIRMLGGSIALIAAGLLGQSFYLWRGQPQFAWMTGAMTLWSFGTHLFMPFSNSVSLRLSRQGETGKSLGILSGANTLAYIIGCAFVWLLMGGLRLTYSWIFRIGALFALLAAGCVFMMKVTAPEKGVEDPASRFVLRKEYSLFYWLSVLFGARKQVFLTFAPWVLIKIYHKPATTLASLLFTASVLGIFFRPLLGRLIDRVGERLIIIGESLILILICLGYGFAEKLGLGEGAVYLVSGCFITDQLLFAVNMARTTYLHKQLAYKSDLTPTLSMGITMDHLVSMTIPALGGVLWAAFGYEMIFLAAACVALINLLVALQMKK
ncbi:MAG: MFS transporter [Firmicutes bacterium]|nr:MFS transporter [Bacillota bacterium]